MDWFKMGFFESKHRSTGTIRNPPTHIEQETTHGFRFRCYLSPFAGSGFFRQVRSLEVAFDRMEVLLLAYSSEIHIR